MKVFYPPTFPTLKPHSNLYLTTSHSLTLYPSFNTWLFPFVSKADDLLYILWPSTLVMCPNHLQGCSQKFPDWLPGVRTANGIVLLWVSLVSFAAITVCVASWVFDVVNLYFIIDSVQKLWTHPHTSFVPYCSYNPQFICAVKLNIPLTGLPSLRRLRLQNNLLQQLPEEVMGDLVTLEHLSLQKNHLSFIPPKLFNNLKHLKYLDLTSNWISSVNVLIL